MEGPQGRGRSVVLAVVLHRRLIECSSSGAEILPTEERRNGCPQPCERRGKRGCGDSTVVVPAVHSPGGFPGGRQECRPAPPACLPVGDGPVCERAESDPAARCPASQT